MSQDVQDSKKRTPKGLILFIVLIFLLALAALVGWFDRQSIVDEASTENAPEIVSEEVSAIDDTEILGDDSHRFIGTLQDSLAGDSAGYTLTFDGIVYDLLLSDNQDLSEFMGREVEVEAVLAAPDLLIPISGTEIVIVD